MIGGAALRAGVCLPLVAMILATALCGEAAGAPVGGVAWKVSVVAQPSDFPMSGRATGEPNDQYVLALTNTGSVASSGKITLTDTLPTGVTVGGTIEETGWECPPDRGASVVTCVYSEAVPALGQSPALTIPVAVGAAGPLTSQVAVSGGGAQAASVSLSTLGNSARATFGFLDFSSQSSDLLGQPDTQAGGHPYALTTTFDLSQQEGPGSTNPERAVRIPRAMQVDLPAGLIGNPQVPSQCTMVAVLAKSCPTSSRVGTAFINFGTGIAGGSGSIYNVVPEHGYPAEFALYDERVARAVFMYASVRTESDYGLRLSIPNVPPAAEVTNVVVTFFGDPRRQDGGESSPIPFFTNPSDCSGEPLVTKIEADSWEEPESWVKGAAQAAPVAGCEMLQFQPAITVTPNTTLADEPTGYNVDVEVPQSQATGLEGLATPDVKNVTVTFPQGVSLSPGVADGLAGCPAAGAEGINLSSPGAGHCPLASQVGTVEAHTPLLAGPLEGHVYVALPGCGGSGQAPCTEADAVNGTLFGVYLELEGSGVVVKQRGAASANPITGQLTTSFKDVPQQPFSDLRLTLKDGPRAPLANPQSCGEALTTSDITPWSSPQTSDANPSWAFTVTGCEGSPFAPTFAGGTTNTAAGAYTDFSTTFTRADRTQDLSAIQVQTPPGLLGMLSHVTLCEEPQATWGTCSSASQIGTATASVGAGSHPFWVRGPVYLTGPYKGRPFGLSVAIPAQAGPFNLGTVVARATLNVNPETAALTITSDPLPQILDGVPLRVQTVNVTIDRPQFIFNPTNCNAQQITAKLAAAQGAAAQLASPFAAGGCKNLPFDPGFKVSMRAPGSRKNGVGLDFKVSSAPGQANIQSVAVTLPKQLPARLTTIQRACPAATFDANPAACPAASLIGIVRGVSPVLPVTLTGPVYLVSHGGAAFPDLDVILQGEGVRVDLKGSINIAHGITSSTFANVPDVPVSSFELKLPEGPHSALAANGSLCAKTLVMPTTITGQNGRRLVRSTKIAATGCPKRKPKLKKRKRRK